MSRCTSGAKAVSRQRSLHGQSSVSTVRKTFNMILSLLGSESGTDGPRGSLDAEVKPQTAAQIVPVEDGIAGGEELQTRLTEMAEPAGRRIIQRGEPAADRVRHVLEEGPAVGDGAALPAGEELPGRVQ